MLTTRQMRRSITFLLLGYDEVGTPVDRFEVSNVSDRIGYFGVRTSRNWVGMGIVDVLQCILLHGRDPLGTIRRQE